MKQTGDTLSKSANPYGINNKVYKIKFKTPLNQIPTYFFLILLTKRQTYLVVE